MTVPLKWVCVLGRSSHVHISVHNLKKPTNATEIQIYALTHFKRKMMII